VHEYAQKEIEVGISKTPSIFIKRSIKNGLRAQRPERLCQDTESIKSGGDQAFERNDFKLAERNYEVLLRNWIHFSDLTQSLSFQKAFLEKRIKTSRCLFTEEQVSWHLKAENSEGH